MSGIYQRQTNSATVKNPSANQTLISVNETGELFTKDSSGNVSITQPKFVTVETSHVIDVESLFGAIIADPFDVEQWKASYTVSIPDESVFNGVYETGGDFSTEVSYANLIGLSLAEDGVSKETLFAAAYFLPTGGPLLGGLAESNNIKVGAPGFNGEWTYTYEEDSSATGSDPKYVHDFRIEIDSTQILGYVVINADDSEYHNFIIDSPAG